MAYEYGDPDGIDDVLNRVQSVHDEDLTVLAEFRYLGAGTPAVTVLSEPGLERRWKALEGQPVGDAGDPYTGYDRFGRVENMLWWKPSTSTAALQVGWGYDRASRRTWRRDALADAALLAGGDQAFTYDALSQVRGRDVGRLNTNATAIGGIPAEQEAFRYDEAGNWLGYELLANGAPQIEQTRVSNRSNQLVQVDGSSAGLSYDANGNMLTVPTGDDLTGEPRRLEWDAWNRLRRVYNNGGTLMAEYEYDAQARRIVVRRSGEEARQIYYNDSWRSVEERQAVPPPPPSSSSSSSSSSGSSVPVPVAQQVWQPASRWEMILRDRATTPGGELDQRGYPLKDVLDVVALSDAGGAVIERYSYSAFGGTTFMNASFEERSASAYGWEFLFHAEFRDADTGWYNYGYRYYSTELGRWLARDPIGEQGGINFYEFCFDSPTNLRDINGLEVSTKWSCHAGQAKTISLSPRLPDLRFGWVSLWQSLKINGSFKYEVCKTCCEGNVVSVTSGTLSINADYKATAQTFGEQIQAGNFSGRMWLGLQGGFSASGATSIQVDSYEPKCASKEGAELCFNYSGGGFAQGGGEISLRYNDWINLEGGAVAGMKADISGKICLAQIKGGDFKVLGGQVCASVSGYIRLKFLGELSYEVTPGKACLNWGGL